MKKKFTFYIIGIIVLDILFFLPCHGNLICKGPSAIYLQYFSLWVFALFPISLFSLILNDEKYKIWLKYTLVSFLITMILVFITPEYDSGIVSVDRELVSWFLTGLYSFISIIYFIVHFIKNRKI